MKTVMEAVSEIRAAARNGQTVELDIAIDKLIMRVATIQARADLVESQRETWRDNKRRLRMSQDKKKGPHTPKEKTITPESYKNNSLPPAEPFFDEFWQAYPRKVGKGAARKAFRHAATRAENCRAIIDGAKRFAATKPDPQFTPHPTSWLNADRWLDEDGKVVTFRASTGPQKTYREQIAEKEKSQ